MAITPFQQKIRAFGRGETPSLHHATRTGKVVGIHEHYDDANQARLELEDEAPQPKAKKGQPTVSDKYGRRFEATVPKQHTAGLKLGDRVHVHTRIEKAAGAAAPKLKTPSY